MQNPTFALGSRSLVNRPDDFTGPQVHVIYAVPKGGVDRQLDLTNRVPYSLAAINNWLQGQIGRKVRFDTYQGELDITFAQLPKTNAVYDSDPAVKTWSIRFDLGQLGLNMDGKNLLVFYAGGNPTLCGESSIPTGPFAGQFSIVYAESCWTSPAPTPTSTVAFSDWLPMHEMFHAFGAYHVPEVTPAQTLQLTQQEELYTVCDLMYVNSINVCAGGKYLDALGRYYYSATVFTDGRVNTYDSPFLTPPLTSN